MWVVLLCFVAAGATSPPGPPRPTRPVVPIDPPRPKPSPGPAPLVTTSPATIGTEPYAISTTPQPEPECEEENEIYLYCKVDCPTDYCPESGTPGIVACDPPNPCLPGCACKVGYRRKSNTNNTCIPAEECPPQTCQENEEWNSCPSPCLGEYCEDAFKLPVACNTLIKNCQPRCVCKPGFYRDSTTGSCVSVDKCPQYQCGANETFVPCEVGCPTEYCPTNEYYSFIACSVAYPCPPGCACSSVNSRRRSLEDRTCIPIEECPPVACSGINEVWEVCPSSCRAENCEDANKPAEPCVEETKYCQPQCVCAEGHYRNDSNVCVQASECPKVQCGANETLVPCQFDCPTNFCPRNEYDSLIACSPPYPCQPGCACSLSNSKRRSQEDRTCIPIEDCPPVACSGLNEVWDVCPSSCRAENCEDANKPAEPCAKETNYCLPRCVCAEGHYKNGSNVCVPASECPKVQCGANETLVPCQFDCPTNFCPRSEYDYLIACSQPYPCQPGCACNFKNSKRRSLEDRTCIPIEECPPVICSGVNEVWNVCPSSCRVDNCEDLNKPTEPCFEETRYCRPQCVCADGYYKNASDVCVPASECPLKCDASANLTEVACTFKCPYQFCPDSDYQEQYACKPPRDCPPGCGCKLGYRYRSYDDLTCILAEDCPAQPCTSQPNEVWNPCPSCLAESCADANNPQTGVCNELVHNYNPQCVCKEGFYRNDSKICVPKAECPLQCDASANLTEVACTFKCPYQFCPDSDYQEQYACKPPRDCPPGCGCQLGYRYRSYDDLTCILAEDCPAQSCTSQPNEIWNPCPSCLAESCADANNPQTGVCNELVHNCNPQCVCKEGFYRNDSKLCVPKSECPLQCDASANLTEVACTFKCPYQFCPDSDYQEKYACKPPRDCPPGCGCKLGYRYRSYYDLTCILAEDCHENLSIDENFKSFTYNLAAQSCTSQPNEVWNPCPSCLAESCADADNPDTGVCNELVHNCNPQCVCKEDFYRNESKLCVSKSECQKCGPNERYVQCKAGCPTDYCPEDDNQFLIACDPPYPCTGGCICELNYKMRSTEDPTCIPIRECPPVNCTRPNEVWSPCTSPCYSESCQTGGAQKDCDYIVDYCESRCICAPDHLRNDDGTCVPKDQCRM